MGHYWRKPRVWLALFILLAVIAVKALGRAKLAHAPGIATSTPDVGRQPEARPRADTDDQPGTASELEGYT